MYVNLCVNMHLCVYGYTSVCVCVLQVSEETALEVAVFTGGLLG